VETPTTHDAYAAFRIPAYRRYFTGNLVFILGLQMLNGVVGWEMYERTGSALNLGFVGLVQFIPQLAFVAVAGHITDIYNRKHVLMAAISLSVMAALVLALNAALQGTHLCNVCVSVRSGNSAGVLDAVTKRVAAPHRSPFDIQQCGLMEHERI
jgi:MFS family permease